MRWTLAQHTEVVGRRHDAASHQVMPNSIDDHARRQRIGGVVDLASQFQSTAARFECHGLVARSIAVRKCRGSTSPGFDELPRINTWSSSPVPSIIAIASRERRMIWDCNFDRCTAQELASSAHVLPQQTFRGRLANVRAAAAIAVSRSRQLLTNIFATLLASPATRRVQHSLAA